jgi:hypothetical protein
MSATIGTIAGATGLGSARQVVWAPISQLWWAFQFTGTTTLASWYSSDGSSWTAGATKTLAAVHSSEGRDLQVYCKSISNIDTVWFTYVETPAVIYSQYALRATISGTTLTYHTTDTKISQTNISAALAVPRFSSGGLTVGTDNKVHVVNGALDPNQDITWIGTTNADPGTAEQSTLPTWGTQTVVDNSQSNTVKSGVTFPMPNADLFHIGDDGTSDSTTTGLVSYKLPSGGSWSTVGSATGTIGAIDKNDWGATLRTTSDIHLVYRNSSGTLIHRRYDGASWSAGQTIPTQSNLAGGGVALTSDGTSVWLAVIDTNGANTVRYIQWTSGDYTGHGDAWDLAWTVLEGSSATRTQLGLADDIDASGNLIAYWTEGTSMVAATAPAPFPPDPPGLANRDIVGTLGTATTGATTLVLSFTTTQPVAAKAQKIVASFWYSTASARTITSVVDNASSPNSYTLASSSTGSAQGCWIYWLDLPVSATWTGNYTVTVTFSGTITEADGGLIAYSNMQLGSPTATNQNTSTSASATPGACSPPATPATYVVVVTDATGANPATFTWPAPYLKEITQTNGSTQQAGSVGDALNGSGSKNPAITIDSALWNATQAVWPGAPYSPIVYQQAFPRLSGLRVG